MNIAIWQKSISNLNIFSPFFDLPFPDNTIADPTFPRIPIIAKTQLRNPSTQKDTFFNNSLVSSLKSGHSKIVSFIGASVIVLQKKKLQWFVWKKIIMFFYTILKNSIWKLLCFFNNVHVKNNYVLHWKIATWKVALRIFFMSEIRKKSKSIFFVNISL